jgi:hypothetical protein
MSSAAVMEHPTVTAVRSWDDDEVEVSEQPSALELLSPVGTSEGDKIAPVDSGRRLFDELADELAYATRGLSSTRLASEHPAYAEIMVMGDRVIPWLVERLETPGDRPIWLRVLGSLTRFQPGAGKDTISEAANAWITWAKLRG